MTVRLRGLTWDHPRGYVVLDALARELAPEISVRWHRQPLEDFESRPLRTLADDYDLLVIDHPGLGEAVRDGALRPLDDIVGSGELVQWRTAAVGASFASYQLAGRQWALPLDAAAQVSACRPDLMDDRPASWAQACQAARSARTTLCLGGPHALLMFSAICVAAGTPPAAGGAAAGGGEFVSEAAGLAALAVMADLLAQADRELSQRNPIGVLEAMAAPDGPAYCPLVYGYLTYQRRPRAAAGPGPGCGAPGRGRPARTAPAGGVRRARRAGWHRQRARRHRARSHPLLHRVWCDRRRRRRAWAAAVGTHPGHRVRAAGRPELGAEGLAGPGCGRRQRRLLQRDPGHG